MFYNASPELFAYAQKMRNNMTHAEKLLWHRLKENALGVRIKPQHPIDIFIADFYSHAKKLVIEIDGPYHKFQIEKDNARTKELENFGLKIIRFTNDEVVKNIELVLEKIKAELNTNADKNITMSGIK
jgi:very-short-patch-repair endonuclease